MNPKGKALLSKIGSKVTDALSSKTSYKNPSPNPIKLKTPMSPRNKRYKENMEGAYKSKYGSFK